MMLRRAVGFFGINVLFLVGAAQALETNFFSEGNAKYKTGDYAAAASLYEKAIASGKASAAVYYNLGNADFRAGNRGKALVDYERAHALDPRDRDVEWNKAVLKNALPDRIENTDDNVFLSSVRKLLEWVTLDETALAFSLLLGCLFLLSALHFIFHKPKSIAAGLSGFLAVLWILSAAVFYSKWFTEKDPRLVVLDKEITARYGPSDKETKAFILHEGAEAKVIDWTDEWYYILLENKTTGWVLKKSCEIL